MNSTHNAESILEFESLYKLKFDDNLQSKKSEIALEAEFIHCNYKGGQCAMEKYLGKVKRSPKSTNKNLSLDLKIK